MVQHDGSTNQRMFERRGDKAHKQRHMFACGTNPTVRKVNESSNDKIDLYSNTEAEILPNKDPGYQIKVRTNQTKN